MRIISKIKDYYDGVAGTMGIDKTIIYDRIVIRYDDKQEYPQQFKKDKIFNHKNRNRFHDLDSYNVDSKYYDDCSPFIIGFCGKLYVGWKFYNGNKCDIIYDEDFVKENVKLNRWNRSLIDDLNYIKNYNSIDLFREFNTPVFIFDNDNQSNYTNRINRGVSRFIINGNLKDYQFYKVFDSFLSFQEIQMFISGVLGVGENTMVEIEDKYKIKKHGFDEWSFRKESTKRNKK